MEIIYKLPHGVIQTTEGRKDLGNTHFNVLEILRFALNDNLCQQVYSSPKITIIYQQSFTWIDNWESDQTYTGVEIVLVIDDSGSMTSNDRYNQRLTVAQTLVENLPSNSKIGIVEFEQYTTKWTESLVSDKNVAAGFLNTSYFQSNGGWTKMYNGIQKSFELIESTEDTTLKMMVVLNWVILVLL